MNTGEDTVTQVPVFCGRCQKYEPIPPTTTKGVIGCKATVNRLPPPGAANNPKGCFPYAPRICPDYQAGAPSGLSEMKFDTAQFDPALWDLTIEDAPFEGDCDG